MKQTTRNNSSSNWRAAKKNYLDPSNSINPNGVCCACLVFLYLHRCCCAVCSSVLLCCVRFHSCSFVCTTRILNVNVFQTNKRQPTCMKWAQHIQQQQQKGFFYFLGLFFLSIYLSFLRFCCCCFQKKKCWAYDRFPNFSLHFCFALVFLLVSTNSFISVETS